MQVVNLIYERRLSESEMSAYAARLGAPVYELAAQWRKMYRIQNPMTEEEKLRLLLDSEAKTRNEMRQGLEKLRSESLKERLGVP
jgi:hypothetical protein